MADEIAVDETGWPVVTNRQVQYPARVRIVPTAEDDVVDLEAVPGDVEAEGTDVGEGLFGAVRNYVDSRDGTKADGAYVEQEVGRVDGAMDALGGRVDGVAGDVEALDGSKVAKAGDTMTGGLTLSGTGAEPSPPLRFTAEDSELTDARGPASMTAYLDGSGRAHVTAEHPAYGVDRPQSAGVHNELVLGKDATTLKKPLTVASGGTAGTTKTTATNNIGALSLIGGTEIPANANLNNYTTVGNYFCPANVTVQTLSNKPSNNAFRMVVSIGVGASGDTTTHASYIRQDLFTFTGGTYTRTKDGSTWSAWKQVYTSGDVIPIANGGTGAGTVAGVKTNLGITDVARVNTSFNLESGHLTGTITYYMKNGIVFVGAMVNRVAGGSLANGARGTGVTLPTAMRPKEVTRSCQLTPTNNTPNPCPNVGIQVNTTGTVDIWYGAINAPSTGNTWTYAGWIAFGPAI